MKNVIRDSEDVTVRFRIRKNPDDDKIRELFSGCTTNKERSDLTREALNFYAENKDKVNVLNNIEKDIHKVLLKIDELKSSGIEIKSSGIETNLYDEESEEAKDKWSSAVEDIFKF